MMVLKRELENHFDLVPTFSENCWVSLGLEMGGWCGVTVLCPLRMPVSICMKSFDPCNQREAAGRLRTLEDFLKSTYT